MAHEQDNWLGISWLYSTYMWVWAALLILTIIEVLVPEPMLLDPIVEPLLGEGLGYLPRSVTVVSLIVLAIAKTVMVAWYYMHLVSERPSIIMVACAPFLFSIFLTIGIWPQRGHEERAGEEEEASAAVQQVDVQVAAHASSDGEAPKTGTPKLANR